MAEIEWTRGASEAHESYAFALYIEFGFAPMLDYLKLIDEAIEFIAAHPFAGSPTISVIPSRRVKLTSHKQYQVHYDHDCATDVAVVVAIFK